MDRRIIDSSDEELESRIIKVLIEEYEHQFGIKCTYREVAAEDQTA